MPGAPFRNRESVLGTPWLPCAINLTGESIAQRSQRPQRRNWSGALNELLLVLLPLAIPCDASRHRSFSPTDGGVTASNFTTSSIPLRDLCGLRAMLSPLLFEGFGVRA
jgi:hypothetical protein